MKTSQNLLTVVLCDPVEGEEAGGGGEEGDRQHVNIKGSNVHISQQSQNATTNFPLPPLPSLLD